MSYAANFYEVRPIAVSEQGEFFVLALNDGRFLKVSEDVKRIVDCLTAARESPSCSEIASRVRRDTGRTVEEAEVRELIDKVLVPQGIVVEPGGLQAAPPRRRVSRLWAHLRLFDGRRLERLARGAQAVFSPRFALAAAAVWSVAILWLVLSGAPARLLSAQSYRFGLVGFLLFVLPGGLIHELGHALSCFKYGVRAREMGVGLYLFQPVLYTDMSEAWLLPRRQRIVTDLAGCYFSGLYLTALTVAALFDPAPTLLWAIAVLTLGTLTNLNPFLRYDGYWVLTDALGVVNVHRRALRLLGYAVKRTLGLAPSPLGLPQLAPWAMRLLVGLSALYLLFTAAFLTLGFYTVVQLFADPAARHGFVAPFAAALRHGSLLELLQALRSGGVMSVMVLYGVVLIVSLLSAFVARLGVSFARRRPAGPNGQEA